MPLRSAKNAIQEAWASSLPEDLVRRWNEREGFRGIILNTGWLIGDRIVAVVVALAVSVAVVRYLGPDRLGAYQYALAFCALMAPIAQLGLDGIVVRNLVEHEGDRDQILGTSFLLMLATSVVLIPIGVLAVTLLQPNSDVAPRLVGIMMIPLVIQSTNVIDYFFRARVQSKYTVWSTKISLMATAALTFGLIAFGAPLVMFAWTTVADAAIAATGLLVFYRRSGHRILAWMWNRQRAIELLADSWPLMIAAIAGRIYSRIGVLILGQMSGQEAVGIYSVALRLSEPWYFITLAIVSSVFPSIIRARREKDRVHYEKRIQLLYDLMATIGYAVAIPMTFLATPLVVLLFGRSFEQAGPILAVHIWVFVFISIGMARSNWLVAENLVRLYMAITLLGAVLSILLCWLLIPRFGGLGVAIAAVGAQAFMAIFSSLLSKDLWPVFRQTVRALLVPFRFRSFLRSMAEL